MGGKVVNNPKTKRFFKDIVNEKEQINWGRFFFGCVKKGS